MREVERAGKVYKLPNKPNKLNQFQEDMYIHLINWKREHITTEPGIYKNEEYDAILPESVRESYPTIYPPILEELYKHQAAFPFRKHRHFYHMASSQVANINLFMPLLLHPRRDEIFGRLKKDADLETIVTDELYKGFCFEFSGNHLTGDKGPLGDKSSSAGTDADIAIAYRNKTGELCLWLIEHKLTEADFTNCGGAKSNGRTSAHICGKPFTELLEYKDYCFYHSAKHYEYWNVTEQALDIFVNAPSFKTCPFKGGMNQLWRNHLLGLVMEKTGKFKQTFLSVVKHPQNQSLDRTIAAYRRLINDHPSFSVFNHREVVDSALQTKDPKLEEWARWYTTLYQV